MLGPGSAFQGSVDPSARGVKAACPRRLAPARPAVRPTGGPATTTPSRPAAALARGRPRRVTILQVAEAAGVSIATVSRVLSGRRPVRADLEARVRQAAADLGYRPNAAAQGLATGVSHMVGVVVPNLANPYFYDIIKAMNAAAVADGYRMLVADAGEDPAEEVELARGLLRSADGLVLISPRMPAQALRGLADPALHVVVVNRVPVGIGLASVTVDNQGAMLGIAGHLATLGHRTIAYLAGPEHSWQAQERLRAIRQAEAFGLEVTVVPAGATIEAGHGAVDAALAGEPTALVCFSDLVAFGALARLAELGVRVPRDVSLTGFDDIAFARFATPALTTVANPLEDLGAIAWSLLRRSLRGEPAGDQPPLRAPIVVRDSTAPPRTGRLGA
jgi:LacI family transcriptional regulator, repressor for deo operon, udp, cdd, tsx, nupC, and nupG